MATYAIGDVQGCYTELRQLLSKIDWSPDRDRLWFVGDLVNRGPDSLKVLRFIHSLESAAQCVLGNHDLHLLARTFNIRAKNNKDTFDDVLQAKDREKLIDWLRHRPLFHHDPELGFAMVHAGIAPQWSVSTACELSSELSSVLRGPRLKKYLRHMYGDEPTLWSESLPRWERLRFVTNAFTRARYCSRAGALVMGPSGPPEEVSEDLRPWFTFPRTDESTVIVFGHWATLKLSPVMQTRHGVMHVDHGCVWGGLLSAVRLEDGAYFSVAGWRTE